MIPEIGGDFMQWLRGFFYVAHTGSVTQAALKMGRNQPTISHHIRCLERQFGVVLFDRSGGRMTLTPEGKALLKHAVSLFEIFKTMESELVEGRIRPRGTIRIAATHAVVHNHLPPSILAFQRHHPEVTFAIEGGGLDTILARVGSAEVDFGVLNLHDIPKEFVYHPLFQTDLKLIAPKNNAFGLEHPPNPEAVAAAPFIFFPHTSTISPLIEEAFASRGLQLRVVLVLNNFNSVKHYVSLGCGVSILDDFTLDEADSSNLDVFSLDALFEPREYGLLFRKQKYLSPAVRAFLRLIKPNLVFLESPAD